jgi:hypothetical protein
VEKKSKKEVEKIDFDIDDFFSNIIINPKKKENYISWKNGAYKIYFNVRRFFCSPKLRKDLNLLEQVENLLNSAPSEEPSSDIIDKCHQFIKLHRITENTSARRRLERWATRIIVMYLIVVLILVILNSIKKQPIIEIPNAIMITILSTTTVNIIGLGLIVLRGHFYNKDDDFDHLKQKNEDQM